MPWKRVKNNLYNYTERNGTAVIPKGHKVLQLGAILKPGDRYFSIMYGRWKFILLLSDTERVYNKQDIYIREKTK